MFGVYLQVHPWIQVDLRNYLYNPNPSIFLQRSARHSGPTSFSTYPTNTPLSDFPQQWRSMPLTACHYYNSLLSCHHPVSTILPTATVGDLSRISTNSCNFDSKAQQNYIEPRARVRLTDPISTSRLCPAVQWPTLASELH